MENDDNIDVESMQRLESERRRFSARRRMLIALSVFYILLIILVLATFIAYPEFFSSGDIRRKFVRENYQFIVILVTASGALITGSVVAPKTITSLLDAFVPTRAFASAVNEMSSAASSVSASMISAKLGVNYSSAADESLDELNDNERTLQIPKIDNSISSDEIVALFILRMRKEQDRLKRSSLSNLIWGVVFAVSGLATLSYPLFFPESVSSVGMPQFLISYIPRASLAVTIALSSFFFLRLYASNEYDLKHTKNEITTFESKVLAAKIALEAGSSASIQTVIDGLASSERNFVLKSGEKTISTEVDTKYNDVLEILRQAIAALPNSEKK